MVGKKLLTWLKQEINVFYYIKSLADYISSLNKKQNKTLKVIIGGTIFTWL